MKPRKLPYYGHTMRKQGNCRKREIMQGTMPGACRRGRPRTAWMDNKKWTGLSVEQSILMTEDRDKWRKCVHGTQARKTTHGLDDNIKTWTGLPVEESIRMTED